MFCPKGLLFLVHALANTLYVRDSLARTDKYLYLLACFSTLVRICALIAMQVLLFLLWLLSFGSCFSRTQLYLSIQGRSYGTIGLDPCLVWYLTAAPGCQGESALCWRGNAYMYMSLQFLGLCRIHILQYRNIQVAILACCFVFLLCCLMQHGHISAQSRISNSINLRLDTPDSNTNNMQQ